MNAPRAALLLVDDDEACRDLLRLFLTPRGFDITDVDSADSALDWIGRQAFDLVLLDIQMPEKSGLEVLSAIRQRYSAAELPVMMATVLDGSKAEIEALNQGANDYITKPFDLPVVLARIQTQTSLKRALDQIRSLNEELSHANQQMDKELRAASEVQQALVPSAAPRLPGLEFGWYYRPCSQLAGDLLGVVSLPGDQVCLYVLDVVDHGVKAALLAVMINRVLSRLISEGGANLSPAHVADQLNREFPYNVLTEQFFTIMLGILDCQSLQFRFVSAGHPGPFHYNPKLGVQKLRYPSLPIGLSDGPCEEHQLQLERGDRLLLYSDGLVDAMSSEDRPFGEERCAQMLLDTVSLRLMEAVGQIVQSVEQWCKPGKPHDDITLAAVGVL